MKWINNSFTWHLILQTKMPSNLSCKSQQIPTLVSRLVLQLSLPNPMKPGVKSRMKMQLEQRRQAMFQLHLSNQQFYCLQGTSYIRGLKLVLSFSLELTKRCVIQWTVPLDYHKDLHRLMYITIGCWFMKIVFRIFLLDKLFYELKH